jgi:hypothetical protein
MTASYYAREDGGREGLPVSESPALTPRRGCTCRRWRSATPSRWSYPVVADEILLAAHRLDEMEIFPASDLAQDDVAHLEHRRRRLDGTQLPRLDLAAHRMAAGPE